MVKRLLQAFVLLLTHDAGVRTTGALCALNTSDHEHVAATAPLPSPVLPIACTLRPVDKASAPSIFRDRGAPGAWSRVGFVVGELLHKGLLPEHGVVHLI